jgi:hypothetical protein
LLLLTTTVALFVVELVQATEINTVGGRELLAVGAFLPPTTYNGGSKD